MQKYCRVFDPPLGLLRNIWHGDTSINKAIKSQEKFKSDINEIVRGKWEHKSEEQRSAINNVKIFYEAQQKVINLFDIHSRRVSEGN